LSIVRDLNRYSGDATTHLSERLRPRGIVLWLNIGHISELNDACNRLMPSTDLHVSLSLSLSLSLSVSVCVCVCVSSSIIFSL